MIRVPSGAFDLRGGRAGLCPTGASRQVRAPLFLLVVSWALMSVTDAAAERIVLVRPEAPEEASSEVFNRLRGELGMHGFEVIVISERAISDSTGSIAVKLALAADERQAAASVSFVAEVTGARASICLRVRRTRSKNCRIISTDGSPDAARILALRAAELLRASLSKDQPEPNVSDEFHARPMRARTLSTRQRPAPSHSLRQESPGVAGKPGGQWSVGVEFNCVLPVPSAGVGLGPGASLRRQFGKALGLELVLAGPLLGSRIARPAAQASVRHELGLLEFELLLWRSATFRVNLRLSGGALHLVTQGEAGSPWFGRADQSWVGAAGAGLGANLAISPRVALTFRSRLLATAPRVRLVLADEQRSIDSQLVLTGVGLEMSF